MDKLRVRIPLWYKPFIRFMPNFWMSMPSEKSGKFTTRVDILTHSFAFPIQYGKEKGEYTSIQKAYLKARWRAMWKCYWTKGSGTGINWVVIDASKKRFITYGKLSNVEDVLSEDDIITANLYYGVHKDRIDELIKDCNIASQVSQSDSWEPMLWSEENWNWFLNFKK